MCPFSGPIVQLSITYNATNRGSIHDEATLLSSYKFDLHDTRADAGPNNILAVSQNVYQWSSNKRTDLLLKSTDSFFQSSDFTLHKANAHKYSSTFWVRLPIIISKQSNSAITVLQLVSKVECISSNSYIRMCCYFTYSC